MMGGGKGLFVTRNRTTRALFVLGMGAALAFWCPAVAAPPRPAAQPPAAAPATQPAPKNVLLISWDGMDRTVLKELLEANRLPHLAAIIKEGSLQAIEVTGHTTDTMPGHAQMLTGLDPRTSGVVTNHVYQPIPEGYTIFERVQKHLGKDAVRTVLVASKTDRLGGRGPGEYATDDAASRKGEPYFLTKKHLDVFDAETRRADQTGPLALKYLAQFKPAAGAAWPRFLCFVHFADPDAAGHAFRSNSAEYRAAAVACDEALGSIVDFLKKEKLYDDTRIYVTADHGFDKNANSHNRAPSIFLATNDKAVTKGGTQADVPATILQRFGVDLSTLKPPLIGKPLTATGAALTK